MWKNLSIKIQLISIMTLLVILIEGATLFVIHNLQQKDSKITAINQVDTLTKSLNNDLIKVIFSPTTDAFSDINLRLSGFKNVKGLLLLDDSHKAIFEYKNTSKIQKDKMNIVEKRIIFSDDSLYIKKDLIVDNFTAGYTILEVDLSEYIKKQDKVRNSFFFIILPFSLFVSLLISIFLSKIFTRPFNTLIDALEKSDPTNNKIVELKTNYKNEIKNLFDGFNNAMNHIKSSSEQLKFQATHDQLTGLYNRFYIENEIKNTLNDTSIQSACFILFNLDEFKLVNDSAGVHIGDNALKTLSSMLKNELPKDICIARTSGDNFAILLKNHTKEDGVEFINKYLELLKNFRIVSDDGRVFTITSSISMVNFKAHEYTLNELLKASVNALKLAKSNGRNRLEIYDCENKSSQRFDREIKVANFINEALLKVKDASRFELFAQDIVPLQYETDKISYEILIRMWDNENNFIAPDDFLPTAQRYQKMVDIDIFVLWQYLEQATASKTHLEKLHCAHINLAGSSLNNPRFQEAVKKAVISFDFPWKKLELEITESSAVGDFNEAKEFISWLKNIGIGLALDDFGTGMASFEYLKSLPFDVVKIDGSFVKDMHDDETDKSVIKYIHEIASYKNQETVAEYVETQRDVDVLRDIGITYGQGYFLGKPRSFKTWIDEV